MLNPLALLYLHPRPLALKVIPLRMLHYTGRWSVLLNILQSHELIYHMQLIKLARFSMHQLRNTFTLLNTSFSMSREHCLMVSHFYTHPLLLLGYSDADWARCTKTRQSTYGYSTFLVVILSLRVLRNNLLSLILVVNLSNKLLLIWLLKLFRSLTSYGSYMFFPHLGLLFCVTTVVPFFLAKIQFLTNEQNTLTLIITLIVNLYFLEN